MIAEGEGETQREKDLAGAGRYFIGVCNEIGVIKGI